VSRIEQSGRMALRRPKPLIKGSSAPEEEEEEEEVDTQNILLHVSALHACHHQGVFTVV